MQIMPYFCNVILRWSLASRPRGVQREYKVQLVGHVGECVNDIN